MEVVITMKLHWNIPLVLLAGSGAGTTDAFTSSKIGWLPIASKLGSGHSRGRVRMPIFLTEVQLREDAWQWSKETSKTNRPRPSVLALFNDDLQCVYVGNAYDSALLVGHMVKKHGKATVACLREEPFPPEVESEPIGVKMMESLVASWLDEIAESRGDVPIGNSDKSWAEFDASVSPFLIGAFGDGSDDLDDNGVKDPNDMTAEELMDSRREKLFNNMNDAMRSGDEATAMGMMKRLGKLGEEMNAKDDESNADADDSTDTTLGL